MSSKKQKRFQSKKRTNNVKGGQWSGKQLTVKASGREAAYTIGTINGSGGVLLPNTGTAATTDTGGRYTIIDCASLGARVAQLSRLYNQWRVNRIKFQFRPESFNLGSQSLTSIVQFPLQGYLGVGLDPTIGLLVQTEIIETGGREMNFARPAAVTMGKSAWLYTQPRVSDTLSDNRFVSPGILQFQRNANGAPETITLGQLEVLWDIDFRYPIDADEEPASRGIPMFGQALIDRRNELFRQLDSKQQHKSSEDGEEKNACDLSFVRQVPSSTLSGVQTGLVIEQDSPIIVSSKTAVVHKSQSAKPRLKISI